MSPLLEDSVTEIRRRAIDSSGSAATLYVVSVVVLCALTVIFVLGLTVIRPESDNTSVIAMVIAVVVPVATALLAGAVQQTHLAVNSRLGELLELTAKASKAEGELAGGAGSQNVAHAQGKAEGIEQERVRKTNENP